MTGSFHQFTDPVSFPAPLGRPVIAIGNFDGVHLGHRALIDKARDTAARSGISVAVLTFSPHPRQYFQPDKPLFHLTSARLKADLLARAGVDTLVTLTFGDALASLSAEDFIRDILVQKLRVSGVVIGQDFHFGNRRLGTVQMLTAAGHEHGYATHVIQPLTLDGGIVSSSRIRTLLSQGNITGANRLLGREWHVSAEVRKGDQRGRELGYPTANLHLAESVQLKHGIYAVRAAVDGKVFKAVASFGRRPTFDDGKPKLEVHLFDHASDLYGKTLDVFFVDYIRAEQKFDSIDALIVQMDADSLKAKTILAA